MPDSYASVAKSSIDRCVRRYALSAVRGTNLSRTPVSEFIDDRLPLWPVDMSSILYGRINNPEWSLSWRESSTLHTLYGYPAAFAFGCREPLVHLQALNKIYMALLDSKPNDTRRRAEAGLLAMEDAGITTAVLQNLSLGVSAPLRETLRTAQLSPGGGWSVPIYRLIGRNDLAEGFSSKPAVFATNGYRPMRDILVINFPLFLCFNATALTTSLIY